MKTIIEKKNAYAGYYDLPKEYYILYSIRGITGAIRVYDRQDAHPERRYRVYQTDGCIIESPTLKNIYSIRGQIADAEVSYIEEMLT